MLYGEMVNSGCVLLHELQILGTITFPMYKLVTNSHNWLNYISLVLGRKRQGCSLMTINCEPRPFLKGLLIEDYKIELSDMTTAIGTSQI